MFEEHYTLSRIMHLLLGQDYFFIKWLCWRGQVESGVKMTKMTKFTPQTIIDYSDEFSEVQQSMRTSHYALKCREELGFFVFACMNTVLR